MVENEEVDLVDIENPENQVAPADKLSWGDFAISLVLGGATVWYLMHYAFPCLVPDSWNAICEAARVRPVSNIVPGVWQLIMGLVFKFTSLETGLSLARYLGYAAIGFSTALVYLFLRELLCLAIRLRIQNATRRLVMTTICSIIGAILFACADPVWNLGQTFTRDTLMFTLTIWMFYRFFRFLMRGSLASAYFAMFIAGILSAETPAGFILLAILWIIYMLAIREVLPFEMPLLNPYISQVSKWHMTFLFFGAFLCTIGINCLTYVKMGGSMANDTATGALLLTYGQQYVGIITSAASGIGWGVGIVIALVPCFLATLLIGNATDDEKFLPYHIGLMFFGLGLLSYFQLSSVSPLWFWRVIDTETIVSSNYLLGVFIFCCVMTLTLALSVIGTDAYCRDHRRLAAQMFAELDEDEEVANRTFLSSRLFTRIVKQICIIVTVAAMLVGAVPGRNLPQYRKVLGLLKDYVKETVRECEGAKHLFTQGSFDSILELEAKRRNQELYAHSLIQDDSPRAVYLRSRGMADKEDTLAMVHGADVLLRMWVHDKPQRLADAAVQLCFELWRRDGKAMPDCTGVLSRPKGLTPEMRSSGIKEAQKLADRVIDVYRTGGIKKSVNLKAATLLIEAQFRLARIAQIRAQVDDINGRRAEAYSEVDLARKLDSYNFVLVKLMKNLEKITASAMRQMTPREGLQYSLARADFITANNFAQMILDSDPQDPDANFAVGMYYYTIEQYTRAEDYLMRCLIRRPQEPAIYNNIAMVQYKSGRFETALLNAKKALSLVPDSSEVQETVTKIEQAIKELQEANESQD